MDDVKTAAQLDHRGRTSHEVYTAGFYEGDWDFSVRLLLGKATRGVPTSARCWPPHRDDPAQGPRGLVHRVGGAG